jgi:hypothetical protein
VSDFLKFLGRRKFNLNVATEKKIYILGNITQISKPTLPSELNSHSIAITRFAHFLIDFPGRILPFSFYSCNIYGTRLYPYVSLSVPSYSSCFAELSPAICSNSGLI